MEEDLTKYEGITYKFYVPPTETFAAGAANTTNYCNCLTLARMFYKDHGYQETWDDGKPLPQSAAEPYKNRLILYLSLNFVKENDPEKLEYGDVALIKTGLDNNIGIYVGNGNMLTIERPTIEGKSKSVIYRERLWKPYFRKGFKRKIK